MFRNFGHGCQTHGLECECRTAVCVYHHAVFLVPPYPHDVRPFVIPLLTRHRVPKVSDLFPLHFSLHSCSRRLLCTVQRQSMMTPTTPVRSLDHITFKLPIWVQGTVSETLHPVELHPFRSLTNFHLSFVKIFRLTTPINRGPHRLQ
jgi:hypothetical protein